MQLYGKFTVILKFTVIVKIQIPNKIHSHKKSTKQYNNHSLRLMNINVRSNEEGWGKEARRPCLSLLGGGLLSHVRRGGEGEGGGRGGLEENNGQSDAAVHLHHTPYNVSASLSDY